MKRSIHDYCRRAASAALGVTLGFGALAPAIGAERIGERLAAPDGEIEVFIRLDAPSVAELNTQSLRTTGKYASSEAQKAQAARVEAQQAGFRQLLANYAATELSALRVGANGLRLRVPVSELSGLRALPGVKSVGRVELHTPDNIDSVPWIGAPDVWSSLGLQGEDVSIGIIDTGIDYLHANFGGAGNPADYAANNKNIVEAGTFPTAKVVGGFDFAGPTYNANVASSVPAPDGDPLDGNGHGSHVAGSAAGFGVAGTIGSGVAPQAELYALKVFSDAAGSTNLTSDAIEWAMDPNDDGDMSDHLDVINMSLGSPFGSKNDPSAITAQNAADAGIIVVASAGNEGDLPYVTGAPAVADGAISVAANHPGGRILARVNVTAPASIAGFKFNEEGSGTTRVASVSPLSDTLVRSSPLNGCAALTNAAAVATNIVLMQRGTCTFQVKVNNAQAAGARAVVMYNNVAGDPFVMGLAATTIPAVMVSLADGNQIAAQTTTTTASLVQVTLDVGLDPSKDDRIAAFSSRGPGHDGSGFKPDVSAPGLAIVSTRAGSGTAAATLQGTSMASPHAAGAAALLHQEHPHVPPYVIKSLLQNSSVNGNASGDTSLARHGVGAIRVDSAAALTSFALPGGVSFGRINPTALVNRKEDVLLENWNSGSRTFAVTHVPQKTYPGVTVTCPSAVTLGSFKTKTTSIRLRFDPKASAAAGAFDNASISQTEVDGWCIFSDGTDTLRVGYLAVVDAASTMVAAPGAGSQGVDVKNNGPAIGFAEGFTLVGSGHTGAENSYSSISKVGVRRGDPDVYGGDVIEFGISVDLPYEHISNLEVDVFLDTNGDGTEDTRLVARDWTSLQSTGVLGTYVTAQFVLGGTGFIDWIVSGWDFNDRALVLPFSLKTYPAPFAGLVPDSFSYRLVLSDRQGNQSTQTGTVDLADEIVPDLNSFGLEAGDSVHVNVSGGEGQMLWLFPTNNEWYQDSTAFTTPGGAH